MRNWEIRVEYRTRSGCNAKDVIIEADRLERAVEAARAKVMRMRGVIRIDSCQWLNWGGDPAGGWPKLRDVT